MFKKLFGILISVLVLSATAQAAEYYVDCNNGNDSFWNNGSQSRPYKTIQKAASLNLKPGDVINVMPGVYYGPVNITAKGTAENPITLRAVNRGKDVTVITGANQNVREGKAVWECCDEENNIWVIDYTVEKNAHIDDKNPSWLFPARVLCDEVDLFAYMDYATLESGILGVGTSTYSPGYKQGYYYDHSNNKLYVKLRTDGMYGSSNPNEHSIKVSPSLYRFISKSNGWGAGGFRGDAMGEDSFNICVGEYEGANGTGEAAESAYVVIDGFTLETPGYAGIFLRASDVTISNCYFRGCRAGVRGAARTRSTDYLYSKNIVIEHCDWSQFPVYDEAAELVSEGSDADKSDYKFADLEAQGYTLPDYYWWQRKSDYEDVSYECGGFTNYMGENWIIRNNYIHDCFEGMSFRAMQKYQVKVGEEGYLYDEGSQYIEIYGNIFEKCLDNAIELEDHGRNISIHDNYFTSIPSPISWQPLNGTPWPTNIKIYRNVIHNTRDFNNFWVNKANKSTTAFKIMVDKKTNLQSNFPWMEDYPVDSNGKPLEIVLEDEGMKIFNNTIVMPGGGVIRGVGSGTSGVPHYNIKFMNNAVVSDVYSVSEGTNGARVFTSAFVGAEFAGNVFADDSLAKYNIIDTFLDNEGKYISNPENMGFKKLTRLKLSPELEADSVLIGAGVIDRHESAMSRDVGALQYGEIFDVSNAGCEE